MHVNEVTCRTTRVAAAFLTAALALAFSTEANAAGKIRCEVLTIEATRDGGGIDAALASFGAVFKSDPFKEFNSFRLTARKSYELGLGVEFPLTIPSPYGGKLRFEREIEGRLELALSLTRPQGAPILVRGKATAGTPFFAAGLRSERGRWVFAVICDRPSGVNHF